MAPVSTESLLKVQNLRSLPRPTELFAFSKDFQVVWMYSESCDKDSGYSRVGQHY